MAAGDSLLSCTDGLTNMIDLSEIEKLSCELDVNQLVHQLIDLANQNGGVDNSTVVCVKVS